MVLMRSTTLYLNLRGATDLIDIRHSFKMKVYVVASIWDGTSYTQTKQTAVDKNGEINPIWNCPIEFTINESAAEQTLVFKLWCSRKLGHKIIGEVCVHIGELLAIMRGERKPVTEVMVCDNSSEGFQGNLMFSSSFHQITNPPPPPPQRSMKKVARIVVNVAMKAAAAAALFGGAV